MKSSPHNQNRNMNTEAANTMGSATPSPRAADTVGYITNIYPISLKKQNFVQRSRQPYVSECVAAASDLKSGP